jgi:hypothetical protein
MITRTFSPLTAVRAAVAFAVPLAPASGSAASARKVIISHHLLEMLTELRKEK